MTSRQVAWMAAIVIAGIGAEGCVAGDGTGVTVPREHTWFDLPADLMHATFTVNVRNGTTPLDGVRLHYSRVFGDGIRDATTDANGSYTITTFPELRGQNQFWLWLSLPTATYVSAPVDVLLLSQDSVFQIKPGDNTRVTTGTNGHDAYVFDIDLAAYSSVRGRVLDLDGAPVPGLSVALRPHGGSVSDERRIDSGADGSFSFLNTKAASLDLGLDAFERLYRHVNRAELEGMTLGRGVDLQRDIRVLALGEVYGQVLAPDRTAVPGATIALDDGSTTTSSEHGSYSVLVGVGEHTVSITPAPGYAIAPGGSPQTVVRVTKGLLSVAASWTLVRTAAGTISGRVVTEGGSAVPDATVSFGTRSTRTTATGDFTFLDVTPGAVVLTLTVPAGYQLAPNESPARNTTAVAGQTASVPPWVLRSLASGTIVARVRNSGEAYAGASVRLADGNRTEITGADGTATFASVAPGLQQLTLTVPSGFVLDLGQTIQTAATVVAGQSAAVAWNIVNVGTGTSAIQGTVRVAGGTGGGGVANVLLTLSNGATTRTSTSGAYQFSGVPAGVYQMTITVPSGFLLAQGQSPTVRVVVKPSDGATTLDWNLLSF